MVKAFLLSCLFYCNLAIGQSASMLDVQNEILAKSITSLRSDPGINADSTLSVIANWNQYPSLKTNTYYLYIHHDPAFGEVPLKVFIPASYNPSLPSPAVLLLHGAVVRSSFNQAYTDTITDKAFFFEFFKKENYVIIRPFADGDGPDAKGNINFDWVINHFNKTSYKSNRTNPTFSALNRMIINLKQVINLDDNHIFAFGFSDGADGVFGLNVYNPSAFAGFVAYNSMLTNSFAYDIYLHNTHNRPMRIIHSDKDEIRPVEQTQAIVRLLDSINSPVVYKEYKGFQHFDLHLQKDLPACYTWIKKQERDPFPKRIYWEISDTANKRCDWLVISAIDTSRRRLRWHTDLNLGLYSPLAGEFSNQPYYRLNKSGAVNASYRKNKFTIQASSVSQIEVLISPLMINMNEPVTISINGKTVFEEKVTANKEFLLDQFCNNYDRKAIWVNIMHFNIE